MVAFSDRCSKQPRNSNPKDKPKGIEVLICTQTFPPRLGGMEAVMHSLALQFQDFGCNVTVAADRPWDTKEGYSFFSVNAPKLIRASVKRLLLSLRGVAPRLTICDSWKSVAAVPKNSGFIVVLAHGQEYLQPAERRARSIRAALKRADLVISSSEMTADLVRRAYPTANIHTIYPTYMLQRINLEESVTPELNQPIKILSLCRIEMRKGLLESLTALEYLKKEGFEFVWQIAGVGPDLDLLKRRVSRSVISQDTQFLGRVSAKEKHVALSEADLFLMPSYQVGNSLEGFGISYIEAAQYSLAAIGGAAGGAPEAVLDGQTGWCVDGSNPDEIATALRDALSNTDKLHALGRAAQARFNSELAGDVSFAKLLSLSQLDVDI